MPPLFREHSTPVPQAVADDDRHVGTIAELVDAFATAPSTGTRTVTLTTSITGTAVLSDAVAVAAGATMVLDLNGKNLILAGRTAKAGLGVPAGTALTITDTAPSPGTLTATGGFHGAGIGGADDDGGTVTVAGGAVTATGGTEAAGIGGGHLGDGGTVTVTGGVVTATGGWLAAGISGGYGGAGGVVTVAGGVVTATGGQFGAGIGGGYAGAGADVEVGEGAEVTASSGSGIAVGPGEIGTGFGSLVNRGRLTVPANNAITIPDGVTVTNNGTLTNSGTLTGAGTIINQGAIVNTGTVDITVRVHHVRVQFHDTEDSLADAVVYAATFAQAQQQLPNPTWTGRQFVGWYTAQSGGTEVTNTTDLGDAEGDAPKQVDLYARWVTAPPQVQLCMQARTADPGTVIEGYTVVDGNGGSGRQIVRATGDQQVTGGSGDDVVCGWGGGNTLDGGSGHDIIIAMDSSGGNRLLGGAGNDTLIGYSTDTFDGGSGRNQITRLN